MVLLKYIARFQIYTALLLSYPTATTTTTTGHVPTTTTRSQRMPFSAYMGPQPSACFYQPVESSILIGSFAIPSLIHSRRVTLHPCSTTTLQLVDLGQGPIQVVVSRGELGICCGKPSGGRVPCRMGIVSFRIGG